MFARHLSIMVKAGMPLLDALTMLQKQTESRSLRAILKETVVHVSEGQFLAASLEKYKNLFGDLFINIIRVGESSGILAENLNYLSDELKKKRELKKKIIGAMIYPLIILVATTLLITMLTVFIFPKILPVFQSMNTKLPWTTQVLIAISNFMTAHGLLLLAAAIGFFVVFWVVTRFRKVSFILDWVLLYIPLAGSMSKAVNIANFSRTLGLLLRSGIKIVEALEITADTLSNLVYQRELKKIAVQMQKGEQISKYLDTQGHFFPPMLSNMVAVGESTGNLSETLLYLSEYYEGEVNEITKNLSSVLEPLLILIMGGIVGFVAVAIITPIYGLTQSVRG